jgi:hypothetical protein
VAESFFVIAQLRRNAGYRRFCPRRSTENRKFWDFRYPKTSKRGYRALIFVDLFRLSNYAFFALSKLNLSILGSLTLKE